MTKIKEVPVKTDDQKGTIILDFIIENCLNKDVKAKFFGFLYECAKKYPDKIKGFSACVLTDGLIVGLANPLGNRKDKFEGYKFDIEIDIENAGVSLLLPVVNEMITDVYHLKEGSITIPENPIPKTVLNSVLAKTINGEKV